MKRMRKWIFRGVLGLVVLLVVGVLIALAMIDRIAKAGVEYGGEYALGVPTKVDSVRLSLLGGTFRMDALNVANPQGFSSPHLLKTGRFDLAVRTGSIFSDTVEVTQFVLDGLDVNIEQTAKGNNISAVLDHVKKLGGETPAQEKKGGGKKVKVDKVTIRNVVARVHLPLGGAPLEVKLPELELTNVSSEGGVPIAHLMGRLVPAVLAAVVEKGGSVIPTDLAGVLKGDLAGVSQALGGQAAQLIGQAQKDVQKALADAQKQLGGAATKAADELQKGVDALKGILPPKK